MPMTQMGGGPMCREVVPGTGIFPNYLRVAGQMSPAPFMYHIASLLTTVAAVASPTTKLLRLRPDGKQREEILTMWAFLAGPPNNGKSYSCKMAKKLAAPILGDRLMNPIGSLQGLEEAFRRQPNAFLYMNEAGRFLRENRASWMRGDGAQFWCDVFDGEIPARNLQERHRKDDAEKHDKEADAEHASGEAPSTSKSSTEVRVSLLGAAATGSLLDSLKPGDWEGGLMSRVLFISESFCDVDDDWFDWPEDAKKRLREGLYEIQRFCEATPTITWQPDAYELYRSWFQGTEKAMRGLGSVHADALARLTRHVRVICALYATSCLSATITLPVVRVAITLGDYARGCTLSLHLGGRRRSGGRD